MRGSSPTFPVLVVATKPEPVLVTPEGRAVEPLVHPPQAVEPTGVRRVRVVDDSVLHYECADPRLLARVGRPVGGGECGPVRHRRLGAGFERGRDVALAEVVFDNPALLLFLRDPDPEVVVEVTAKGRRPRKAPAHSLPVL